MTPTIFVLFGITGDLAKTKLLPSLHELYSEGKLPAQFSIVGFARRQFDFAAEFPQFSQDFLSHCVHQQGNFDAIEDYQILSRALADIDAKWGSCSEKIFHLSVSPFLYESVLQKLHDSGMTISCVDGPGKTKMLIEKPIGLDGESAATINALLASMFPEEQIYRIDHYLLKQSVHDQLLPKQDLSWQGVTRIEVCQFETRDVDDRIAFYDKVGAFRDVGQNHLLQILALTLLSRPSMTPCTSRAEVLKTILICANASRAQYKNYPLASDTETAFSVSLHTDLPDWKNTELVLRSAKAAHKNAIEILAYKGNELISKINIEKKPHEGYEKAYEKALSVKNDGEKDQKSYFVSEQEVVESWRIADKVRQVFASKPLGLYEKGTDGTIMPC